MVLFILGLLGLLMVNAKKLSDTTRGSFRVSLFFKDTVDEVQILNFQKELENNPVISSTVFVTKTQAAAEFQKQLGEDFVEFLGYNPLPASLDVTFKPNFTESTDFENMEREWLKNPLVEKVDYPRNLIIKIIATTQKLSWFLLAFSALLLVIAISLINNTIRLTIYSKRFLIKTMQLVGATRGFIRGPFLRAGFFQGFFGGLLAAGLLAGLLLLGEQQIPELKELRDLQLLAILGGSLLAGGVILSLICTFFAIRKYLNLNTDSLY
jgi:cell division transport system permease protein